MLGALKGHDDDQILSMGVIVFVAFSFWMIVAHAIFAVFMAESGMGGRFHRRPAHPGGADDACGRQRGGRGDGLLPSMR